MTSRVKSACVTFAEQPFAKPLTLSSGTITTVTEARVSVTVEAGARQGTGHGSIYLSDLWAWPDPALPHSERDARMRAHCEKLAHGLADLLPEAAHPLELGLRLHEATSRDTAMPRLAALVCGSPFDAAIQDATGQALGRSVFQVYREPFVSPSGDPHFPAGGWHAALEAVWRTPPARLPGWLVVGKDDSREAVAQAVRRHGFRCFKLKLGGNPEADAASTSRLMSWLRDMGVRPLAIAGDSNEASGSTAAVLDYLDRLQSNDNGAYDALLGLEQPTSRDLAAHPMQWQPVTRRKHILLDEGLDSCASLHLAHEQGYSGLALKSCKGHSFMLLAAAWARQRNMLITLQDLTNPGLGAIHNALLAAHLRIDHGVEINSPQFTPAANAPWLPRLSALFDVRDGCHGIPHPIPVGLGSSL